MDIKADLANLDAIILCGGLGTRMKSISGNLPKSLIKIKNKFFIDIVIEYLLSFGIRRIILALGYKKEYFKNHTFPHPFIYQLIFSEETEPLGTGGAVKYAKSLIKSNPFLVLNGDTICYGDLSKFSDFHLFNKTMVSMLLSKAENTEEFGNVILDVDNRIISFKEKVRDESGLINAGMYFMDQSIFELMPQTNYFSLEYDLFPKLPASSFRGFLTKAKLIDIGTPQRYKKALSLYE